MQTHTYYDLCDVQGHPSPVALASMHDLDGAQLARLHSRAVMAGHATVADEIRAETERRATLARDLRDAIHDPALDALIDALTGIAPAVV